MLALSAIVAVAKRGYAEHGKVNSMPLSKRTTIIPFSCRAEAGMSIKVFMPLVDDKLLVLDCKIFCFCQFFGLQSD